MPGSDGDSVTARVVLSEDRGVNNPTVADAILDRLIHNAHRLILKGDSMRKLAAKQSGLDANPAA